MNTTELPPTVQKALGEEAAHDLVSWLDARLSSATPISAFTARQKANVFVLENISNLLLAATPELQEVGNRPIWHVPIDLTLPKKGRVGRIGTIAIDATYGEVHYDEKLIDEMTAVTERLMHEATTS